MKIKKAFKKYKEASKDDSENSAEQYRKMPTFIILFSGLSIFFIGLYLTLKNSVAIGLYQHGRSGQGRGQMIVVSGSYLIFFGIIFMIFPMYILIKQYFKNKRY